MTYDVIVGGKTYKFNTQKEQEDFINQGYINHNRMYVGNNIALTSKPDNKPLLDPNKTYNVQLPEVEVTNGQTKTQNTGHNDPIFSQIFQGNYFGKKFVPTEQNINHYLNLYKGDRQNNEKFAPKEWMKVGGMHLLAGAAIPTIATAPIATAIGAAGGYASDWLWRNYTGKSFGDNVLDWAGLQNYSNPYIDSDMIRDTANALEPLAFFTGGLGVDDITGKYITNKLIPRTKNNLAGAAMRFNTTDNVMAPSEDLMFRPVHNIWQENTYSNSTKPLSLVGYQDGIPQYTELDDFPDNYIYRQYITREAAAPIEVYSPEQAVVYDYIPYGYSNPYYDFDNSIHFPYKWYFDNSMPSSRTKNHLNDELYRNFKFSLEELPRTKKTYNKDNYHEDSFGIFIPVKEIPKNARFLFHSPGRYGGGSTYWISKDGKTLYRQSDHWGDGIKDSSWYLKGDECPGGHCGNTFKDFYTGAINFSDLKSNDYYSDPNVNFDGRPLKNSSLRNPGPKEYARKNSKLDALRNRNYDKITSLSGRLQNIYLKLSDTEDQDLIKEQINLLTDEMNSFKYRNPNLSDDSVNSFISDIKFYYQHYIDRLDELLQNTNKNYIETVDVPAPKRRRIRRNQEAKEIEENIE